MNRRRFLAAAAAGAGGAVAGCTGHGLGRSRVGGPDERLDDDGAEKHLQFVVGGERLAVVTLDQMTRPTSLTDPFRLRLHVAHRSDEERYDHPTTVERFRFDLRAPPSSVQPPAEIYLEAPGGPSWPTTGFHRTADSWTRITSDDATPVGAGTLTLSTLVRPIGVPADEVGLRAEVALSTAGVFGRTDVLEASTRFAPVQRGTDEAGQAARPVPGAGVRGRNGPHD